MFILLQNNFTLFSLQIQVTECIAKPKKWFALVYFSAETNFRVVNLILLTVLISVTALNQIQYLLCIMNVVL